MRGRRDKEANPNLHPWTHCQAKLSNIFNPSSKPKKPPEQSFYPSHGFELPYLNFDWFVDFHRQNFHVLLNIIVTTLDSYVEQGLAILKLRLYVEAIQQRWLQLARQCNVIDLHLDCDEKWEPTFWREIFMTKSLQALKVNNNPRCELVLSRADIKCCNLNTLDFRWVHIDYVTFLTIMSYCPLIEKLRLSGCALVNHSNGGGFVRDEFASLKMIDLFDTDINDEQLQTILSKTPKLEDFNLCYCYNLVKPINLSSVSLKHVDIAMRSVEIIRIDAPNLCLLECVLYCHRTTRFAITSPASKGEVNVHIVYHDTHIDASWFHGLREFLSKFAKSNVKITSSIENLTYNFKVIRAIPLPHLHQFESLIIKDCFPSFPFFDAFFTICHPKAVLFEGANTLSNLASLRKLRKALRYRRNPGCCKLDENKCWRHYIKDAKLYHAEDNARKPLYKNELEVGSSMHWNWMVISLTLEWRECSD